MTDTHAAAERTQAIRAIRARHRMHLARAAAAAASDGNNPGDIYRAYAQPGRGADQRAASSLDAGLYRATAQR